MKILSKVLIFSFFLLSIFYLLPSVAHANTTPQTNYPVANTNPNVPNNLHNWTQNVMIEVMSALTCQLAGVDPTNPKQSCLGIDSASGKIGFLPSPQTGGAIGFMGNMIATLYTPPFHTADYFQNLAQNFGISKKTYAQTTGTGFQGLSPLIGVWSAFRNIVYLFLVIIFVVIGLAIMLRVKIDPRTVMTIQNQIPKIIIGILVVTFSFAIAGFLIDLMWVFIYLIYGIFSGISPEVAKSVSGLNPSLLQGKSVLEGATGMGNIHSFSFDIARKGSDIVKDTLGIGPTFTELNPLNIINPLDIGKTNPLDIGKLLLSLGSVIGIPTSINPFSLLINIASLGASVLLGFKTLSLPPPEGFTFSLGWVANLPAALPLMSIVYVGTNALLREALPFIIIYLIIFIALFTALIRLWFALIMAYVSILIDVVLAPFWIIGGIVPGSPISLSGWLRDLIANLAAFPAVIGMFMLGKVFMDAFTKGTPGQQFVPPLIGNPGDPSLIGSLIGLGIILMTPNVVNMLKAALKAPKLDTGGALKGLGAGAGALGGITKSTVGAGSLAIMGDPFEKGLTGLGAIVRGWQRKQ